MHTSGLSNLPDTARIKLCITDKNLIDEANQSCHELIAHFGKSTDPEMAGIVNLAQAQLKELNKDDPGKQSPQKECPTPLAHEIYPTDTLIW